MEERPSVQPDLGTFRIILRTAEEKADLEGSWARADEDFFAAGACHVLAAAFLRAYPTAGYQPLLIQPSDGQRGGHVVVATERWVFDSRGFNRRVEFLRTYTASLRAMLPSWSCAAIAIDDPIGWNFCAAHGYRHPSQFFRDPRPRARLFLRRFPTPKSFG